MSELKRVHDETCFEWTAHDIFSGIKDTERKILKTMLSRSFTFCNALMRLKLAGCFLSDPDDTTLGLIVLDKPDSLLLSYDQLQCIFSLKNPNGTQEQLGVTFMKTSDTESMHSFAKLCEVIRQKLKQWPSNIASITFIFEVQTLHGTVSQKKKLRQMGLLSQNFKDLYADKESCDTILRVKGRIFNAHKAVLIARSKVFAAMFQHDTSERQTGIIKISDCDPNSFNKFLEYLYCGEVEELSYKNTLHLYETSEKYNVQELKMFCATLLENVTVDTFYDKACLADKYNDVVLMVRVQEFFNLNPSQIVTTSEWDYLSKHNSPLANKLLNGLKEMAEERLNRTIARAENLLACH